MAVLDFWPLFLVASTLGVAALYPDQTEFPMRAFLLSPPVVGCVAATVVCAAWGCSRLRGPDRKWMLWHLTNATWWSFGCDVLAGYFGIVPTLTAMYAQIDSKHNMDQEARVSLDSVYITEMCVHIPLSFVCFVLYATRHRARPLVEAFLCGCQLCGTFGYYLPEVLTGGKNWPADPVLFASGIGFGVLWIVLPVYLLARAIAAQGSAQQERKRK